MDAQPPIDLEALLVALVLVPHSYSRNRFFALYAQPAARRVRRRAARIRGLVAEVLAALEAPGGQIELRETPTRTMLRYSRASLALRRTSYLLPLEACLVEHLVDRALRARAALGAGPALPGLTWPRSDAERLASDRLRGILNRLFQES